MRRQAYLKAEQIARMMIQGLRMGAIAQRMGMSYEGLLRITKTSEYIQIEDEVRKRVLGQMDAALDKRADIRQQMQDQMEDDAVPEAWKIVIENLKHKRDLKAALEILDRDPQHQFSKGLRPSGEAAQQFNQQHYVVDAKALAQAIQEADATHSIINKAATLQTKAGEA